MLQINKPCFVVCHGNSCNILEERIQEFKDLDVLWCSISSFDIPEEYILSKINKHFNIVYDSGTVANAGEYELNVRIPRLSKYLDRNEDNYYITTRTDKNNLYELRNNLKLDFNSKYSNKIIYTEDIGINPNPFCVSLHLYLASLVKLGAKKIILFGADGGGKYGNNIESYYKPELVKEDKIKAGNLTYNMVGDTNNVNGSYHPLMMYSLGFTPDFIYNCSPESRYICFRTIDYSEVIKCI